MAASLEKLRPNDVMLHSVWLTRIAAILALRRGEAQQAAQIVKGAKPYAGTIPITPTTIAEAYLAAGQAEQAAGELEPYLGNKYWEVSPNNPMFVYRYTQVTAARAYAAAGNKAKARQLYQDILAAWKNADRGLPLVEQVKAEYAKIQ